MVELYFKLKILIPIILFLSILFFLIILFIKDKIDTKFKKNCFDCKHYKLHSVSSCSNSCIYKCVLKNKCFKHNFNDRNKLIKCKDYEKL